MIPFRDTGEKVSPTFPAAKSASRLIVNPLLAVDSIRPSTPATSSLRWIRAFQPSQKMRMPTLRENGCFQSADSTSKGLAWLWPAVRPQTFITIMADITPSTTGATITDTVITVTAAGTTTEDHRIRPVAQTGRAAIHPTCGCWATIALAALIERSSLLGSFSNLCLNRRKREALS